MPDSQYTGKAGHLALMAELALRGYNVATPEIDKGDDVFAVNDATGAMWRIQVKTSNLTDGARTERFAFRIRESAIQQAQTPELHFIFVLRRALGTWTFVIIDRTVLRNYARNGLGTVNGDYRVVNFSIAKATGVLTCSQQDLSLHIGDWATWPQLPK
jgi:hypothetical protein